MQNGKGMISKDDFKKLIILCGGKIDVNGTISNLDKEILRSITGMQHGKGMIDASSLQKIAKKFTTSTDGKYSLEKIDRNQLLNALRESFRDVVKNIGIQTFWNKVSDDSTNHIGMDEREQSSDTCYYKDQDMLEVLDILASNEADSNEAANPPVRSEITNMSETLSNENTNDTLNLYDLGSDAESIFPILEISPNEDTNNQLNFDDLGFDFNEESISQIPEMPSKKNTNDQLNLDASDVSQAPRTIVKPTRSVSANSRIQKLKQNSKSRV